MYVCVCLFVCLLLYVSIQIDRGVCKELQKWSSRLRGNDNVENIWDLFSDTWQTQHVWQLTRRGTQWNPIPNRNTSRTLLYWYVFWWPCIFADILTRHVFWHCIWHIIYTYVLTIYSDILLAYVLAFFLSGSGLVVPTAIWRSLFRCGAQVRWCPLQCGACSEGRRRRRRWRRRRRRWS